MRIAYIVPSLRNMGPVIVVNNLVNTLIEWGHEVDVFYFDSLDAMEFECTTRQISMRERIDFDNYDIIHSHCLRPDIYVAKWKKKIHKAKIVSTLHQDTYRSFRYQYNFLLSHLFTQYWCHVQSQFDGVVCISKQIEDSYRKRIKIPLCTIYNGCKVSLDGKTDKNIEASLVKIKSKYNILGTYAYVTRRKGLNQIIQALPRLRDWAFVIIGDGPDINNLKLLAAKLSVSDRVLFFPYQKNPCNYLPFFDVYVMPSYSEGFGLAMVEAAMAGKSIVCSNVPSFHEIFSDKEVCFFDLDNLYFLEQAIMTAFKERKIKGELARKRAVDYFSVEVMAQNYLHYYQGLVADVKSEK